MNKIVVAIILILLLSLLSNQKEMQGNTIQSEAIKKIGSANAAKIDSELYDKIYGYENKKLAPAYITISPLLQQWR